MNINFLLNQHSPTNKKVGSVCFWSNLFVFGTQTWTDQGVCLIVPCMGLRCLGLILPMLFSHIGTILSTNLLRRLVRITTRQQPYPINYIGTIFCVILDYEHTLFPTCHIPLLFIIIRRDVVCILNFKDIQWMHNIL